MCLSLYCADYLNFSAGRRLDHFGDLFLPNNHSEHSSSVEPGLSLSSDSDSSNSPPEQHEPMPPLSIPDLHKPDMDSFNDFLIGIGKEYDADGSAGFNFGATDRHDDFNSFLQDTPFSSSTFESPSAHAVSSSTTASHSLYPSLSGLSELNAAHPAYKHGNPLPPAMVSGEFAPQSTFRKADRLMAAPPSSSVRSRPLTEEPEEFETSSDTTRTTSSMRSTFDRPRRRFSMESDTSVGADDDDVSLPAIRPDQEQSHVLPPLRSVPALQQALGMDRKSKVSNSEDESTPQRVARITSGVDDLRLQRHGPSSSQSSSESTSHSATPRTHHLEDSDEEARDSPLPHKRTRTRANSAARSSMKAAIDEQTRQRRLMVLKTLAILSNHLFRLSMLPRDTVPATPKAEERPTPPPIAAA